PGVGGGSAGVSAVTSTSQRASASPWAEAKLATTTAKPASTATANTCSPAGRSPSASAIAVPCTAQVTVPAAPWGCACANSSSTVSNATCAGGGSVASRVRESVRETG